MFLKDDDVSGVKCFISFINFRHTQSEKNLKIVSILFLIWSFYFPIKSYKISFMVWIIYSKLKINRKNLKINLENSFKIKSTSNLWNFFKFTFNCIIFGNTSDLVLCNICFSLFLNFEILLNGKISSFKFFQFVFFIVSIATEYLLDSSIIEHSLTIEKNLLDFSTNLFGFCKTIRGSFGHSFLIVDNVSRVFFDSLVILRLKIKINSEKDFVFLKISKKPTYYENYCFSFLKPSIDFSTRFSNISFFPINSFNCNYLEIGKPNLKFLNSKIRIVLPVEISFNDLFKKYASINEILIRFIDFFWYKIFFSIKHQFNHFLISWILISVIFIEKNNSKIGWIVGFNQLTSILNAKQLTICFKNLIKNTIRKRSLFKNILNLRLFSFYLLVLVNSSIYNDRLEKKKYHDSTEDSFSFKPRENKDLKFVMRNVYQISRFKIKKIKKVFFSIKNIKIFSTINLLPKCTNNLKMYHKIETEIHCLIVKLTGCKQIISLLVYIFTIIKKKELFSHILEILKKRNKVLREMIKNKANRFLLVKVLIKSSLRRLKICRTAILENLIPFRLVNVNYLPRVLFEKKLTKNYLFFQNFEIITFFYKRIKDWKQTTRSDRNSLIDFLKISNKKEKKLALKTLFKVKRAKKLFNNGILNFCSNYLESISYFILFKSFNFLKNEFFSLKGSLLGQTLVEIKTLSFLYKLYFKRLWFFL